MTIKNLVAAFFVLLLAGVAPRPARAHCDTTRGPVVSAARAAIDAEDVDLVLHWVRPEDEPLVRQVFQQTLAVRRLGPEARALADRYFFETLVRIHRAGEGAPYNGLSDREPEAIIAATDRALERGSTHDLEEELVAAVKRGLGERFSAALAARSFRPGQVAEGRRYVAAYVSLTHWVEGVASAAEGAAEHGAPAAHPPEHAAEVDDAAAHGTLALAPWLLAGLFALAALVEGVLLVRRRRAVVAPR